MMLDQFAAKGFVLSFSLPCEITSWGKWMVQFARQEKPKMIVVGYGDDEELAFKDAWANLEYLEKRSA